MAKDTETSRYLKGKATKRKIFTVAKELILAKGYNKVTVDEICETCSLSKGAFYIHYKSKEDIVKNLYREDISEYMDEHFQKFIDENKDANPLDKIKALMLFALGFPLVVGKELTKLAFIVNLSGKSPDNDSFLSDCIKRELLLELIEEGLSRSVFNDNLSKDEMLNYFYTFLAGAFIAWCLSDAEYDIGETSGKFIDHLIKGVQ